MIRLTAGQAKVEILPEIGAGLAGIWVDSRPLLRPWSGNISDGPFALAMILLAPFSNRISGGFDFGGVTYPILPNHAGDEFVLHGDAFMHPWQIAAQSPITARLSLSNGDIGPFRYAAEVCYSLTPDNLSVQLQLTSLTATPLPFGLGFHPWFPRSSNTRLQFQAEGYWPENTQHLPATLSPITVPESLNFTQPAPLPPEWINTGFAEWSGRALIQQGPEAVSFTMSSDLSTAIMYSPSNDADFFCLEPVSHPVNAHNLPRMPGLCVLNSGDTIVAEITLDWR